MQFSKKYYLLKRNTEYYLPTATVFFFAGWKNRLSDIEISIALYVLDKGEQICVWICLSIGLFFFFFFCGTFFLKSAYLENYSTDFHEIFI